MSRGGGGVLGHHEARLHQSSGVKLRKFQHSNGHSVFVDLVNWHPCGPWALQSPADPNYHTEIGHYTSSRLPVAAAQSQQKAGAYKATAYAVKGGCAQLACRDDQSDTTTIPRRGAPLPASRSPVPYSSARPCSCIRATNCRVAFQQSIALYKGQSLACVPPSCRVRP